MKISYIALISVITALITGCASSGSSSVAKGYCPQHYNASTALSLGQLSALAYEENRETLKSQLEKQNLTLDDYDIRNKKYSVEGFIAYDQEKAILAFAGTDDLKDLKNNAKTWSAPLDDTNCGKKIRIHNGFFDAAKSIIDHQNGSLLAHLTQLQNQGKKIYITGHSLGGALATITAYSAKTASASINLAGVYTYGQPYTGDDDFQSCYDHKLKDATFRFVSDKDLIPKTRIDSSFRHVGIFLFFDENGELHTEKPSNYLGDFFSFAKSNLLDAHSMGNYLSHLEKNKEINPFSCQ